MTAEPHGHGVVQPSGRGEGLLALSELCRRLGGGLAGRLEPATSGARATRTAEPAPPRSHFKSWSPAAALSAVAPCKGGSGTDSRSKPPDRASCVAGADHGEERGLQTLSLRLQKARCRVPDAVCESLPYSAAVAPRASETRAKADSGFVALHRALGHALGKKTRVGNSIGSTPAENDNLCPHGFQRNRLAEWMELAVQHAPPSRSGIRAVRGGLQDAYVQAVRRYLTQATMASTSHFAEGVAVEGNRCAPASECRTQVAVGAPVAAEADHVHVGVLEAHQSLEGTLLIVRLLHVPPDAVSSSALGASVDGLSAGSIARLILHSRHPALRGGGDDSGISTAQLPLVGRTLRVRGLRLAGRAALSRAGLGKQRPPLLLPLDVALVAAGAAN